jgi:Major Facilitator Superfamily
MVSSPSHRSSPRIFAIGIPLHHLRAQGAIGAGISTNLVNSTGRRNPVPHHSSAKCCTTLRESSNSSTSKIACTDKALQMMFSVPLYFRVTKNISNAEAGSHLLPAVLSNTFGGLLAGVVIQKTGRYKVLTILASTFASISYALLIIRWRGDTSWPESLEIMPSGFGMGLAFSATFIALQSSVKKEEIAISTGGLYTASAIGMVIGIAASSTVQLGSLRAALESSLKDVSGATAVGFQVTLA